MGVVHRAFDERLHRPVALKALPDELVGDREQLARLEREARSLAAISHANVAMIYGMEQDQAACYLVLELVEGETLHERLERGALGVEQAVAVCSQVAAGLEAVHRKELVHRDLKSSNVMVTPDGTVKLLDFGLARRAREAGREQVTRGDGIVGTPGWMSPEQLRGGELDARSDAWAWGCLLFECLAGVPAFPGESWAERDAATLKSEPDWERLPEDTPESVRGLLADCLSKDPGGRPDGFGEIRRRVAATSTPSSRTRGALRSSLPPERDEFVGREADLEELGERLERGTRLVSVLGVGGTGKTRLVLRLAHERRAAWPGGAWFCDLSEARSVAGIAHAVARALEVSLGDDDPIAQLGHAIAGRGRCLVILDNFEQVARHAEETLARWLERATEAQFIVTTREVLGLPEERSVALAPLVPADAVALFEVRARQRGTAIGEDDRAVVAELVGLLDRLPLAVELAAARVRVLSPKQLLDRMSDRFRLLAGSGGRRDRQATLRATLDWSWELLADWERAALAQASVFEGGFTLEAAEAVLDLSAWPDAPWPMDAVQSLVEKSLVQRAGGDRFDLLVTVQEYAAEKLCAEGSIPEGGSGPEAERAALVRHGEHFAGFGPEDVIWTLYGRGGLERQRALQADIDNLVAACRRAVRRGDARAAAGAFAAGWWGVLALGGPYDAACSLCEDVLALPDLTPTDRARTLTSMAAALAQAGRPADARPHLEEALATARATGDRRLEAVVLGWIGGVVGELGREDEGAALLEEALVIHREVGDRRFEGWTLGNLALRHLYQGRHDESRALLEQCLEALRDAGDHSGESLYLGNFAYLDFVEGRHEEARAKYEEALGRHRESGHRGRVAIVLADLALLVREEGRLDEARSLLESAVTIHREVGQRRQQGIVLGDLGSVLSELGRLDEAEAAFEEGEALQREVENATALGRFLCSRGRHCVRKGAVGGARARLEEAEAWAETAGVQAGSQLGRALEELRAAIDGAAAGGADSPGPGA
jgi:predicted ATPase